jgi:hypothetical protein
MLPRNVNNHWGLYIIVLSGFVLVAVNEIPSISSYSHIKVLIIETGGGRF